MDDYTIISNVHQRKGAGGRPAIVVNNKKYAVENLTQTVVSIPWGVEAVWAVLTPKNISSSSKIQKIVVGSIYSKPDSRKKSILLDQIAEVYNYLCSKYNRGLHWIICGDTNDLKLDSILHLNKSFKQVVQNPTRLDPPKILDPIITTLANYYQLPRCLPPLDSDPEKNGKSSDHLMVVMEPISTVNNQAARVKKKITYRPFNDEKLSKMKLWIENEDWAKVDDDESAHSKAAKLQNLLVEKYNEFFPEKEKVVSSDDQPYFNEKLRILKRRKTREFRKRRKSGKWKILEEKYQAELTKAQKGFFRKNIHNLKNANPKQWYQQLKKLTSIDQHLNDELIVDEIKEFSYKEQAELIANKFAEVSQEYDRLEDKDIKLPEFTESEIPWISEKEVIDIIS